MSEWYFAYGSNLCVEQMIERTGPLAAERPRVARLSNYQLAFNMRAEDGQVFANLKFPGQGVFGAVYYCSEETLRIMDAYEKGYERRHIRVVLENGDDLNAVTYFAAAAAVHIGHDAQPSAKYLLRILTGARQHNLPDAYIREIEATADARRVD